MSPKRREKWGLGLVVLVYSVYYLLLREDPERGWPKWLELSLLGSSIFAVYGLGIFAFRHNGHPWMLQLWNLLHLLLIGFVFLARSYSRFVGPLPRMIWSIIGSTTEILVSPTLIVAMLLLCRLLVAGRVRDECQTAHHY